MHTTSKSDDKKVRELGFNAAGVATNVFFSKIVSLIIAGLAFVLVSRLLGPSTYGIYVLAAAFAGVFTSFGMLGIDTALSKFVSEYMSRREKRKVEDVVAAGEIVIILVGLALTLLSIAFGGAISQLVFGTASYYWIIVVAAVSITLAMLYGSSYAALVGFGRKGFLVQLTLVQVAAQSVASIALVLLGFGAYGPIIGYVIGLAIGVVIAIWSIYNHEKLKFRLPGSAAIKMLLVFSIPIGVYSAVSGIVNNLANLILGEFASTAIVGNVGVALKFGGVMSLAVDSVGIALLPFFASLTSKQHARHTNRLYNYSVYLMLSIIVPLLATVCVVSWNVTVIIWPTYLLLPYLIPIVSAGVVFTMLASYTATILISKNKVRPLMNYSIIVSVVELVLLVIFVPMFKGIGLAVIASLIAPILSFVLYMRLGEKLIALKLDYNKIGRILVASVITAAIIAPIPFMLRYSSIGTLLVAAVLLIVIYPQVVTRFGGLNEKDLTVIKSTSKNMPVVGAAFAVLADYGLYCRKAMG